MDIKQNAIKIGAELNIFDSHHIVHLTGGVTIDRETVPEDPVTKKRIIKIGTILGKITDSGKYGPYDTTANDGRQKAGNILVATLDCTDTDQVSGAVDHARVLLDRLPKKYTQAELDQILKDFTSQGLSISFVGGRAVPGPKATDVYLLPVTISVSVGGRATLSPVFSPINTVDKSGSFETSNASVALIDQSGVVTGVAAGTATITFKTNTGGFAPTASVTVA